MMKIAVAALRLRPKPLASAEAIAQEIAHANRVDAAVPRSLARTHDVRYHDIGGVPVITLHPRNGSPDGELFYIHGGAYVHPLILPHWYIIKHLIRGANMRVTVPLYRLAPEHTAREALPALDEILQRLTESMLPVVIAGDSAGAAIATACASRARDHGRQLPTAIILFSPWVDASMTNPAIAGIESTDPMLGRGGLVWAAQRWAGDLSVADPVISPIRDTLAGLPPISVFQGGRDIFSPDAAAFVEKATAAGTRAELHFYPDAFHVFVGLPVLPESRSALTRAARTVAAAVSQTR